MQGPMSFNTGRKQTSAAKGAVHGPWKYRKVKKGKEPKKQTKEQKRGSSECLR